MQRSTLRALTWGTVAGSVACALWLAAAEADPPRGAASPLAGLDPSGFLEPTTAAPQSPPDVATPATLRNPEAEP